MRSRSRLAVSAGPGLAGCRIDDLRATAPLALRPTRGAVQMVGTAASPVGDDDTALEVVVGESAVLEVRSVAASVLWSGRHSRSITTVAVAEGATLLWRPEPVIATAGCRHRSSVRIDLAPGARLVWWERLVLGRCGEAPGDVVSDLAVDVAGRPLLRHSLEVGPGAPSWSTPSVLAGARAAGLVVTAATGGGGGPAGAGDGWAHMPLDGPGSLSVAVAGDLPALDRALGAAEACRLSPPAPR